MSKKSAIGLIVLCLLVLSGCASTRRLSVPTLTVQQCPKVIRCTLTATSPRTNGELNLALEQAQADWAMCAAQVDMIYNCQSDDHAETR